MDANTAKTRSAGPYFVAILGTFFLMAWLIVFVRRYTQPPPINQARIAERDKALADLEAANADALNNYGWVDQSKGFVRLPITRAVQLSVQEWQNPGRARSNLISMAETVGQSPPPAAAPTPAKASK